MFFDLLNALGFECPLAVRALVSGILAFLMALGMGPMWIKRLAQKQFGQQVRLDGPKRHLSKQGTPTMGGGLILCALCGALIVCARWSDPYLGLLVAVTLGFACVGGWDDYQKIAKKNSKGLSAKSKYGYQSLIALMAMGLLYGGLVSANGAVLTLPFAHSVTIPLGIGVVLLGYFVIVGTSNAVNLTDGLDGLASLPVSMVSLAFAGLAFCALDQGWAQHLNMPVLPHAQEVVVFCSALCGACLGFLKFNVYPAQIFMGDIGSLALGAALGMVAVLLRLELALFIMGGIFVLETVSVIVQVGSYKMTRKRVFKMAPLHHHFELKGWSESKVVRRFWIASLVFGILGVLGQVN